MPWQDDHRSEIMPAPAVPPESGSVPGAGGVAPGPAVPTIVTEYGVARRSGRATGCSTEAPAPIAHPERHDVPYRHCERARRTGRAGLAER